MCLALGFFFHKIYKIYSSLIKDLNKSFATLLDRKFQLKKKKNLRIVFKTFKKQTSYTGRVIISVKYFSEISVCIFLLFMIKQFNKCNVDEEYSHINKQTMLQQSSHLPLQPLTPSVNPEGFRWRKNSIQALDS